MHRKKVLLGLGILALSTALFVACNSGDEDGSSPTSPSFTANTSGGNLAGSTTTNPPETPADPEVEEASSKPEGRIFKPSKNELSGRGTNTLGHTVGLAIAAYTPRGPGGKFIKGTYSTMTVKAGADFELPSVPEPLCDYQADLWWYPLGSPDKDPEVAGPEFQENLFIDAKFGGKEGVACFPPPPPGCNREKLIGRGEEECKLGVESFNFDACKFECKECDFEQLSSDAKEECGDLGFEIDRQNCTFECNEDPCEDAELHVEVTPNKDQTKATVHIDSDTTGIFTINGREVRFEKGHTQFDINLECGTAYTWTVENRCGLKESGRFSTDKCDETCEEEPNRTRLINAAIKDCGSRDQIESLDFKNCAWECKECDVEALRLKLQSNNERCEATGGTPDFRIDREACEVVGECVPCVPEWELISRELGEYGPWSECALQGDVWKQWREATLTITHGNQCNEETQVKQQQKRESRRCDPCELFPDSDECAPISFCHVNGQGTPNEVENQLGIPLNAIQNGHIGPGGSIGDGGYPHCNWRHPADYAGTCNGQGLELGRDICEVD